MIVPTDPLDTALAAFATQRTGELARSIDELGRAALVGFEPPAPRKNGEFQRTWLEPRPTRELARGASTRSSSGCPSCSTLKNIRRATSTRHCSSAWASCASFAPDPRVDRAMLALLSLRTPVAGFVVVIDEIARVLVRHADDETRLSPALDELADFDLELLPAATAKPVARPRRRDLEALHAAVYAAPDDDAPRAVLADALQDAGDPRGELIALQLREHAGDATSEMRERARALVRKHGKTWLGELRPITYRAELRRGFLYELELAGKWSTKKWDVIAHDPALGTVEKLVHGQATGKVVAMLLPGVLASSVRSLEVDDDDLWAVIAATPLPRLREPRAFGWKRKQYDERFTEAVLPYLEQHAQITRVGSAIGMVPLFSKALAARLETLAVHADLAHGVKLWAKLPKLRCLAANGAATSSYGLRLVVLATIGSVASAISGRAITRIASTAGAIPRFSQIVRGGKRELLRVDASTWGSRLELKGLPKTFRRIEVHGNQTFARDLAAKYPKLDVVAMPPPSGKITGVK